LRFYRSRFRSDSTFLLHRLLIWFVFAFTATVPDTLLRLRSAHLPVYVDSLRFVTLRLRRIRFGFLPAFCGLPPLPSDYHALRFRFLVLPLHPVALPWFQFATFAFHRSLVTRLPSCVATPVYMTDYVVRTYAVNTVTARYRVRSRLRFPFTFTLPAVATVTRYRFYRQFRYVWRSVLRFARFVSVCLFRLRSVTPFDGVTGRYRLRSRCYDRDTFVLRIPLHRLRLRLPRCSTHISPLLVAFRARSCCVLFLPRLWLHVLTLVLQLLRSGLRLLLYVGCRWFVCLVTAFPAFRLDLFVFIAVVTACAPRFPRLPAYVLPV